MEPFTEKEREIVFAHYNEAQSYIGKILSEKSTNFFVKNSKEYLSPSTISINEPLDSNQGELIHYTKIRDTLEKLLIGQSAKFSREFRKAPDFIKERLQEIENSNSQ